MIWLVLFPDDSEYTAWFVVVPDMGFNILAFCMIIPLLVLVNNEGRSSSGSY